MSRPTFNQAVAEFRVAWQDLKLAFLEATGIVALYRWLTRS